MTQSGVEVYTPSGGNRTEFFPPAPYNFSEDCLKLFVWTPNNDSASKLPVIVWFFGGGFTTGGADSRYYDPTSWVARTNKHIVVTAKYASSSLICPIRAG